MPWPLRRTATLGWLCFVGWYLLTVVTWSGQRWDRTVAHWVFVWVPRPAHEVLGWIGRDGGPIFGLVVVTVLAGVAIRRRDWVAPATVAVIILTDTAFAWLLRNHVLSRPSFPDMAPYGNTMPSTHMAVTTATVVAALVLSPPRERRRIEIATAAVFTLACALGNVLSHAHWPSDVVASMILTVAVVATVLSIRVLVSPRRMPG